MVDKKYCMSSYMAFRYIEDDEKEFAEKLKHKNIAKIPENQRIPVSTATDIKREIENQIKTFEDKKKGILLSGGMDSAIVASFLGGGRRIYV